LCRFLHKITASASFLVSCISGARSLLLYVVTRFLTDGCFQAHRQVVLGISLPFALRRKLEALSIDLGCFPLNAQYLSTAVGLRLLFRQIHSQFTPDRYTLTCPHWYRALPLCLPQTGTASTAFVENKLSRCLFSLSPLFTTHPRSLQRTLVRPSIDYYIHFSLVMNSSQRFVSLVWESRWSSSALRFHLVFTSPLRLSSPFPKLVDPLYHKYSVISCRDSRWISVVQFLVSSLTVLFTINHVSSSVP